MNVNCRLPSQGLYLDVFQKIKALGFTAVSFYVMWALVEPKRGDISFEGFRDLQPFFDSAKEAGLYLIARPGPYINAEVYAGGFPGWGFHTGGVWRTSNTTYYDAWQGYMAAVGAQIAANEVTKGTPVLRLSFERLFTRFKLKADPSYSSRYLFSNFIVLIISELIDP